MSKKVIVIVDKDNNANLYKIILDRKFGEKVEIHTFSNPEDALIKIQLLPIVHLLFTNRYLNDKLLVNGLDLAKSFKETFPQEILVVTTGCDDPRVFDGVKFHHFLPRMTSNDEVVIIFGKLLQIS